MQNVYKYYISIDWIPILSVDSERYKINKSHVTRPEIVRLCKNNIYEVSDPYLFYCEVGGVYEYFVYYVGKLRIVKYHLLNDKSNFKMCIKSSELPTGHSIIDNLMSPNIQSVVFLKPFNTNNYNEIKAPVFINKDYSNGVICDIITDEETKFLNQKTDKESILISLGVSPNFIKIGTSNVSFRGKAEVQFDKDKISVNIFDVYKLEEKILRIPFNERYSSISHLLQQKYDAHINVKAATGANLNSEQSGDIIIINNDAVEYMLWKSQPTITAQIYNEKLILRDGIIEGVSLGGNNTGTVELNVVNLSIIQKYDSLFIDRYSTYKLFTNRSLMSLDVLKRTNAYVISNFNKRNAIKSWASGKTLIISHNFPKIYDIVYDDGQPPETKSEWDTILSNYNTIVLDNIALPSGLQTNSHKLICMNQKTIDTKISVQNAGEKLFIFLLGVIGSGKSSLVKKIRSMMFSSGVLLLAQIDKLIETDIEYINDPSEENYLRLRKNIYNNQLDQLIENAVKTGGSVLLETTHVDNEYVKWIKEHGYKVTIVVVDENFEVISNNIRIRNQSKIRKTALSLEQYNEFRDNLDKYISNADSVIYLKPSETE